MIKRKKIGFLLYLFILLLLSNGLLAKKLSQVKDPTKAPDPIKKIKPVSRQ